MNLFLIAAIGGLALYFLSSTRPTKMFGPWIGGEAIPIVLTVSRSDGAAIYVATQVLPSGEKFVKIVASTGEAWYYVGDISTFNVNELASYNTVPPGMYVVG